MERLGVIAKVEVPTDWCSVMVVVPKLNESVCRERHPLPEVEQTLAQLAGAQVFNWMPIQASGKYHSLPSPPC